MEGGIGQIPGSIPALCKECCAKHNGIAVGAVNSFSAEDIGNVECSRIALLSQEGNRLVSTPRNA
jgi:hypothetical protein